MKYVKIATKTIDVCVFLLLLLLLLLSSPSPLPPQVNLLLSCHFEVERLGNIHFSAYRQIHWRRFAENYYPIKIWKLWNCLYCNLYITNTDINNKIQFEFMENLNFWISIWRMISDHLSMAAIFLLLPPSFHEMWTFQSRNKWRKEKLNSIIANTKQILDE